MGLGAGMMWFVFLRIRVGRCGRGGLRRFLLFWGVLVGDPPAVRRVWWGLVFDGGGALVLLVGLVGARGSGRLGYALAGGGGLWFFWQGPWGMGAA